MSKLLKVLGLLSIAGMLATAQTEPPLPSQIVGALVWYNQGQTPRMNGSFFAAIPFPYANRPGTYVYNAIDIVAVRRGVVMGVPTTGFAQHLAWMTPRLELFGLVGAGVSFAPQPAPQDGTNVTAAFAGGAGLNLSLGHNFFLPFVVKAVNAQGVNVLVGGVGIAWGK